jgi:hypothetical protein
VAGATSESVTQVLGRGVHLWRVRMIKVEDMMTKEGDTCRSQRPMPRHRPGKRQREIKRAQDQQARNKLNERIHGERNTTEKANRVEKHTSERQFSATEVNAIVQAAVSAAVTAIVTATKELVTESKEAENGTSNKPKSLAERVTKPPKLLLADRISFPKKN